MRVFYFMALFIFAGTCLAEPPCELPEGRGGHEPPPHHRPHFEMGKRMPPHFRSMGWIARTVTSKRFIESSGLSTDQVRAIEKEARTISELNQAMETNILAVIHEQALLYRKVLQDKKLDPAPLYEYAEKIAAMRGEQAKLSIRLLLFVREAMNEEQFKQFDTMLREEGRKRHLERMNIRNRREKDESVPHRKPND
ncbi:MAG: hypothetical protein J5985_09625 [Kiritimatiellae bacterium]|nr:hypothetical protein [Kiritimatiellia bacterium]